MQGEGTVRAHLTKCFLAGLVAVLPVGGLAILIVKLDQGLRPLIKETPLDFPGVAILATLAGIYLVGLTVSTFVGRWVWNLVDRGLSRLPGLAPLYQTVKQILGYGAGPEALFREVVLVKSETTGALEIGLVTEDIRVEGQPLRWAVFVPSSPNPAQGRLALIEPERCVRTEIPVDAAIKALFTTGKSGL